MAKQTDITGTFRVPEEAWGRFWNLMLSIPGADITPNVRAHGPNGSAPATTSKRAKGKASDGSTGRCIVLAALASKNNPQSYDQLNALMVKAGKSPSSLHGLLYKMKDAKEIARDKSGMYSILEAGRKYLKTNCSL